MNPRRQDVDYVWQLPHTFLSIFLQNPEYSKNSARFFFKHTHIYNNGICKNANFQNTSFWKPFCLESIRNSEIDIDSRSGYQRHAADSSLPGMVLQIIMVCGGIAGWHMVRAFQKRVGDCMRERNYKMFYEAWTIDVTGTAHSIFFKKSFYTCTIYFTNGLSSSESFFYLWPLMAIACPVRRPWLTVCVLDYVFVETCLRISSIERLRRSSATLAEEKKSNERSTDRIGRRIRWGTVCSRRRKGEVSLSLPVCPNIGIVCGEIWRGVRWFEKTKGIPLFRKITCAVA